MRLNPWTGAEKCMHVGLYVHACVGWECTVVTCCKHACAAPHMHGDLARMSLWPCTHVAKHVGTCEALGRGKGTEAVRTVRQCSTELCRSLGWGPSVAPPMAGPGQSWGRYCPLLPSSLRSALDSRVSPTLEPHFLFLFSAVPQYPRDLATCCQLLSAQGSTPGSAPRPA